MSETPVIVWFRHDLRLRDNSALKAAVATEQPIICVYIYDPSAPWSYGGASLWWLHHSLTELRNALEDRGNTLILRCGDKASEIQNLVAQSGADKVFCSRHYEPDEVALEDTLHQYFETEDIIFKRYAGYLLFEPEHIKNQSQLPYKVFTPFWRACCAKKELHSPHQRPHAIPRSIPTSAQKLKSDKLKDWNLLPTQPDWAEGFIQYWKPGEENALKVLKAFIKSDVYQYNDGRDTPAEDFTSQLSAHLHFGEISPRQVWYMVEQALSKLVPAEEASYEHKYEQAQGYLRQLGWRDFCHHLLFHWPDLPEVPFKSKFANFPWHNNQKHLTAWQQGKTGIPLVDAGMRQLWHTGWMHNRVRMITASFLIKNLMLPWQQGQAWFWDTLVDANLANNAGGWQWVAGSGADAAPYFRIFNPISQAKKFDPQGDYIRRWVPELAKLSPSDIHEPWDAPPMVLSEAGITLDEDYPRPIVDLKETREQALSAYKMLGPDHTN